MSWQRRRAEKFRAARAAPEPVKAKAKVKHGKKKATKKKRGR
jgi:hypothetical protein